VTLLPIERVRVHAGTGGSAAWFTAAKEPYALVVSDERGVRALGFGAVEVSLQALRETIPELVSMIAAPPPLTPSGGGDPVPGRSGL
jgi:uncharacterized spore protein YtfJ